MTRLSKVLLTLATIFTNQVFADSGAWQVPIDRLLTTGIMKIGAFDVTKFKTRALKIHFTALSMAPASVLSGSRQSAYNRCGSAQVFMHDDSSTEAAASLGQLELHEILGALCFDDRNSALSTALITLAEMNPSPERQQLVETYAHTIFAGPIRLAGGTGVTGGGDLTTLYVKKQVLREIMGDSPLKY